MSLVSGLTSSYTLSDWGAPFNGTIIAPRDSAYQCKVSESVETVGAFKLYGNDSIISYQVSEHDLQEFVAGSFDLAPLLKTFSHSFRDASDMLVIMADTGLDDQQIHPRSMGVIHLATQGSRVVAADYSVALSFRSH
jgi:hypothetical protein